MNIWLFKLGEQTPLDQGNPKLSRTALIAKEFNDAGHNVLWWMSTFDHLKKNQRFKYDLTCDVTAGYKINFIYTPGYRKNFSIGRMLDHLFFNIKLKRRIQNLPKPDLIISSYPTISAALIFSNYAEKNKIPIFIDVRDMWPDLFKSYMPKYLKFLYRIIFFSSIRNAKKVLKSATGLITITDDFLSWALTYAGRNRTIQDCVVPLGYFEPTAFDEREISHDSGFLKSLGINRNDFVICFFGVMSKKIDLSTVAAAFPKINKLYPHVKLVLCGDGDELNHVRSLFHDSENVYFPGWINSIQLQELMKISHIGLAPYKSEREDFLMSMPTKIIEYLSGGLVVVTSIGGHSLTIIKEFACGAYYDNELSFIELLSNYVSNPQDLESASKNALSLFNAKYQGKVVYNKLRTHIENIVY